MKVPIEMPCLPGSLELFTLIAYDQRALLHRVKD